MKDYKVKSMSYREFKRVYLDPFKFKKYRDCDGSHVLYIDPYGHYFTVPEGHKSNTISKNTVARFQQLIRKENLIRG